MYSNKEWFVILRLIKASYTVNKYIHENVYSQYSTVELIQLPYP